MSSFYGYPQQPWGLGTSNKTTELEQLRERVARYGERERQLAAEPKAVAIVLGSWPEKTTVSLPGVGLQEVDTPPGAKLKAGDVVLVSKSAIAEPADDSIRAIITGQVRRFVEAHPPNRAVVDVSGIQHFVLCALDDTPSPNDRVVLDPSNQVIVLNLGSAKTEKKENKLAVRATGVAWTDIGGLADAKRELREAIEGPVKHAKLYKRWGKKATKGILLHGAPGCGKTLFGKAAATALAELHGASATTSGFIYVKGPELLSKWQGQSESGVRDLFSLAREHHKEHGYPALLFIDEADALLAKRGHAHEGAERTIVPQFLAEMDGLDATGALLLLATNRPDALDHAVVRPGRVDIKIHIPRPTREEAEGIATLYLSAKPGGDKLSRPLVDAIWDESRALYRVNVKGQAPRVVALKHLVSGALIAGVVERATQLAIRRELDGGDATGLTLRDVEEAATATLKENRGLDHASLLEEFCEAFRADVVSVDRVRDGEVAGGRIILS